MGDTGGGGAAATIPLAFVTRPPDPDGLLQFDTYRGGADLKLADATVDGAGKVTAVANVRSALGGCAALAGKDLDVRGPDWRYDGGAVIFAARPGAAARPDPWQVDLPAGTCKPVTADAGRMAGRGRGPHFQSLVGPGRRGGFAATAPG